MQKTTCYEQPLNEKVRVLLRIECLFHQVVQTAAGQSKWDNLLALQGLYDILRITSHHKLKPLLLDELERQRKRLTRLRTTPQVDISTLDWVLQEINHVTQQIHGFDEASLGMMRRDEFVNAMRQRHMGPAGSICAFDSPILHYWSQRESHIRMHHLDSWFRLFQPLQEAVNLILTLLRNSAQPEEVIALQGFFQKYLNDNSTGQLIQIILPLDAPIFPDINLDGDCLSIAFIEHPNPNQWARQTTDDIAFRLVSCII